MAFAVPGLAVAASAVAARIAAPREDIAADVGVPAEEVQTIFDCAVDIPLSNQQPGLDLQKRVPGRAGASLRGQRRGIV